MTTLEVVDLHRSFRLRGGRGTVRAVDGVSFALHPGRTVALVGQSGSGKSTVARLLAHLDRPDRGEIRLDGRPVRMGRGRAYRRAVQMIFQDPFSSLNPVHSIGYHLARPLRLHGMADRGTERAAVLELLRRVNLTPADVIADKYPHELSGGQRQRAAIARALAPRPGVLIADEPVSMLDVSIRLEILNLIDRLRQEEDLAVLYITHDLATARHFAADVMVMYQGRIVERGPADEVILTPGHPYTQLLAASAPDPSVERRPHPVAARRGAAEPADAGCRFAVRCPHVMDRCRTAPELYPVDGGPHLAACWLHADGVRGKTRT